MTRDKLIADLRQHLKNVEAFAEATKDSRIAPQIDLEGPQHERMAQIIRRLGCGQTCSISVRYLRAIIAALAPPAEASEPAGGSDLAAKCHAEICEATEAWFSPVIGAKVERRIQSAIDAATAELRAEIERLKAELAELKAKRGTNASH